MDRENLMSARDFYVALLLVAAVAFLCLLLLLLHRFFLLLFGLTRIGVCACMCICARLSVVFFVSIFIHVTMTHLVRPR